MAVGRVRLRVALLLFIGTTSLFAAISRGVFLYGDDILMFEVTESIVRRGDVTVVAPYDIADIAKGTPGHDGRSFAKYGIGQSLVAIPAYVFAWLVLDPLVDRPDVVDPFGHLRSGALVYGTGLMNAVIGGAVVALTYLSALALGYAPRTALVLAALLVTGTLLPHYAASFLSEPLVALTLLAAFYGLLRAAFPGGKGEPWPSSLPESGRVRRGDVHASPSGDVLPLALSPESTSLAAILSAAKDLTFRQQTVGRSMRSFAFAQDDRCGGVAGGDELPRRGVRMRHIDALPWLAISGFAVGLALATRLAIGAALVPLGLWFLWIVWMRWRCSWRGAALAVLAWGLPIAAWFVVIAGYNWYRFRDVTSTGYREEATFFDTPLLEGLYGLLLSPGKGVLWYNPLLILGIVGLFVLWRRERAVTLVIAGMTLAACVFYARYYQWYGGGVWGPRFLVPFIPLLLLPAGELIERAWQRRWLGAAVVVTALLGAFVTALGILVPFDTYVVAVTTTPGALEDSFWNVADSPLVVHLRWLDFANLTPDVAAQRYGSVRLALISLLIAITGLACWGYAALLTLRFERSARIGDSSLPNGNVPSSGSDESPIRARGGRHRGR